MNDIARIIGIAISEFVQYYLLTNNSLFEEQSPSKLDKHKFAIKVEKIFEIKNDFETLDDTNLLVAGFKSLLRRLPMKDFQNFQKFLAAGWNYIKNVCKFNKLHIVFDSYFADSLKECERERMSTCEPLHFHSLSPSVFTPEKFWSCGEIKKS